jgi:hypothetical protein
MERSNSANTPSIWKSALPAGVARVDALAIEVQVDPGVLQLVKEAHEVCRGHSQPTSGQSILGSLPMTSR